MTVPDLSLPVADSALVARLSPSPNFGVRRGRRGIDMIVLHYTGCPSAEAEELWMCSPQSQVSAHYLVEEDGAIVQLVAEKARAWHAGVAFWAGEEDVNSRSIGIEIQNAGHGRGAPPPYPAAQVRAVVALVADIVRRHGISPVRVVGHSDVAPARKADPGEHFPWEALAAAGLALPMPEVALPPAAPLGRAGVRAMQEALACIGYGVPISGEACARTRAVVRAFRRRFLPQEVSDVPCARVLAQARAVAAMVEEAG